MLRLPFTPFQVVDLGVAEELHHSQCRQISQLMVVGLQAAVSSQQGCQRCRRLDCYCCFNCNWNFTGAVELKSQAFGQRYLLIDLKASYVTA